MQIKIMDPANPGRDGWHELYGSSADALNGNISRIFLTGIPQSVPTSDCRQPDDWSCGPHAMAEALGMANGEEARNWLLQRGLITSQYGTDYSGIVKYINVKGYECSYDGCAYDYDMQSAAFEQLAAHLASGYKAILCMHNCRTNYWTNGGHYICAYACDGGSTGGITVDGLWGQDTTRKAQSVFGTFCDGIISNQNRDIAEHLPGCQDSSWEFVDPALLTTGSDLVRAIQRMLGITVDGFFGNETICALQRFLGVDVDGFFGNQSVTAFQNWLNAQ